MSAGTAFARAASQPIISGVRDFNIAADTSLRDWAIKQNLAPFSEGTYQKALFLEIGRTTTEGLRWFQRRQE